MAWVKLHDDILGDPKLMRAARVGGTELVLLPWLLAFASKAADHGRLSVGATSAEPEDLAYQMPGATAAQVEACLRALVAIGVLVADEDGCLRFARWDDRQAKPSASKAAIRERVQKHRKKKHPAAAERNTGPALQGVTTSEAEPETSDVTPCNAPGNKIGNATEKRRGEEKREEEEEKKSARVAAPLRAVRAPLPAWVPRFRERWRTVVGEAAPAVLHRELASAIAVHGEPLVLAAIDEYAEAKSGRSMSVKWFAQEIATWVKRASADDEPLVSDGWLTAVGDRATSPNGVAR